VNVVHVFKDFYPPTTGGIEQHLDVLCSGLARHLDVSVLVPSRSRRRVEERIGRLRVVRVPEFGRYLSAPFCPTMPAALHRLAPDLVHLHFPNPTGDAAYLLSGCRAPVVMTYHADMLRHPLLLRGYRRVFERLDRRVRRIIVASREYLDSSPLLARRRDRCVVVPFGVDADAFTLRAGETDAAQQLRRRYGERLVLFLGVLRPYKGLEVLVRAARKVDAHLLIAGRGTWTSLGALVRQLGLERRVTFLGEVSAMERRLLLHASDVVTLPSIDRREAFGIAQLEAMMCGKPVVASDLPTGVRSVTVHGRTGWLVPPGDADALARALGMLLEDDDLRATLGKAARERVEREFTAERMIASTLALYEQAMAEP
jgi:glycosyltransferase involved in cell wall biosynthesis